jgi:hypothetical protein
VYLLGANTVLYRGGRGHTVIISGKWSTADKTLRENAAVLQRRGTRLDATTVGRSHHTRRVPFLQWNVRQHTGALLSRGCRSQGIFSVMSLLCHNVCHVFMQTKAVICVGGPIFHGDSRPYTLQDHFISSLLECYIRMQNMCFILYIHLHPDSIP